MGAGFSTKSSGVGFLTSYANQRCWVLHVLKVVMLGSWLTI